MQTIYKNRSLVLEILASLVACPDAEERANCAEQDAPNTQPVTVRHGRPYPATDGAEYGDA